MLIFLSIAVVVLLVGIILTEIKRRRFLNKVDTILKRVEKRIVGIRERTLTMKKEIKIDSEKWNEMVKRWGEMEKRLKEK